MDWRLNRRTGPPWLAGFASEKEYEAYAEQQERQRQRREDLERWAFHGLLTEEELARARVRVERRWICAVEGHDWQTLGATANGFEILQCYRCDNVRLIRAEV